MAKAEAKSSAKTPKGPTKAATPKPAPAKPAPAKSAPREQTLVVVESPTKAKTMKKYLGLGYEVLASKGHVKDLPKRMGVDVTKNFEETYEVIEGKEKVVAELKDAAGRADRVLLATDPDREGEAIAVHIAQELKSLKRPMFRVLFHEITQKGIAEGVANPMELNDNLYEAQRTRRVLDRIVGYDVSGLVWNKVAFGLSAGRVQSVAQRLIVDREKEIEAFVPEEYWNIGVGLRGAAGVPFVARLAQGSGEKLAVTNEATATRVRDELSSAEYRVRAVERREQRRNPPAPYTTSKLQQDATSQLRFTAKRTMQIAQSLYEGVDLGKDGGQVGLITYMRTDSVRVSDDAVAAVREHIAATFGADKLPATPNVYKSKKNAQDAHEAIRPASLEHPPEVVAKHLKEEQQRLYKLIWDRFVSSQMLPAVYDQTSVDVEARVTAKARLHATYGLRASGRVLKSAGWLAQMGKSVELAGEDEEREDGSRAPGTLSLDGATESGELPPIGDGEAMAIEAPPGVLAEQKFTQPPARFNEGSLVRELEKRGIGRPSTYAEIISKVQARDYVEKLSSGGFKPTELGRLVVDGLVRSALDFIDPGFTAKLEEELDEVEAGKLGRAEMLRRFYTRFKEQLDRSKKGEKWSPPPVDTGETCDACQKGKLQKRWSKNGWFIGCSNYPKCKNTRNLTADGAEAPPPRETNITCDKCGEAKLLLKSGKFGDFLGCARYPKCDGTRPVPTGIDCPKCGGDLIEVKPKKRGGRTFWGCSNYVAEPSCDFKVWQRPVAEPCPKCGAKFLLLGGGKKQPKVVCGTDKCGFSRDLDEAQAAEAAKPKVPESLFGPGAPKPSPAVKRSAAPAAQPDVAG
ncbi:MAG: type I DNA topoisomerase [Polyangiaceae bacterium]|nr:type I DNA topoisomerase [Polyangiaceae bacterium]